MEWTFITFCLNRISEKIKVSIHSKMYGDFWYLVGQFFFSLLFVKSFVTHISLIIDFYIKYTF